MDGAIVRRKIKSTLLRLRHKSICGIVVELMAIWQKIKWKVQERRQRSIRNVINSLGLFNSEWYLLNNPDVRRSRTDPLTHFMRHGFEEGRRPGPNAPPRQLVNLEPDADIIQPTFEVRPKSTLVSKSLGPEALDQLSEAVLYEPELGDRRHVSHVLVPPLHDPVDKAEREMRALIPADTYDTIICVPWIRQGGADLVAGLLAGSLLRIFPGHSILLVRTDFSHFERPDWIPSEVAVVDLSPVFTDVGREAAERLLYSMFIGLAPKRIINVNSRLCWSTLERFGRRLVERIQIFAYLFCWEIDANGFKQGYPREFYPTTASILTGFFTDTDFLLRDLVKTYSLPALLRDRITPLYSPARETLKTLLLAEQFINKRPLRERPLVLWAGRLDRQKRFDLVLAIAAKMPDVDFRCWGAALLDAPPDILKLPANLSIQKPFKSLDELPLDQCDAWLFTSGWEGLPTLLIDLGAKGIPIAASAVGGVPELITDETGWPIFDIENIDEYVCALRTMIKNPAIRIERARKLQALVDQRHSPQCYDAELSRLLGASAAPAVL